MKLIARYLAAIFIAGALLFTHGCTKETVRKLQVDGDKLEFKAIGSESQKVTVTAENVEWEAAVEAAATEWLKISVDGNVITVTVEDNDSEEDKVGKIVVSDKGGYVEDIPINVTLKKLVYEAAISNFTFVNGGYYGDDADDAIGKFAVVLSLNYDRVVTRTSEIHAKDELYLTFFSDIALDAEDALPKAGRYTVSAEKTNSGVLAGKSKTGEREYEGSYVVSTVDGAEQESKITGGYIEISYADGKCVFEIALDDEAGVLAKYADVDFKYTGNGEEKYANESGIEYYVFQRQRCYYFGPTDPYEEDPSLGSYLHELSDTNYEEVYVSFYVDEEYQFYGLDAVLLPKVYPVSKQDNEHALGYIYKHDLEDEDLWRYGSVAITEIVDGVETKTYVVDGWMAAMTDEAGTLNRIIVNFTKQDGTKFHGRFDVPEERKMHLYDDWTLSGFREDINEDELADSFMRIKDPDYWYGQAGSNQWELYLMGEGVSVSFSQYGYVTIHGPGDCFQFEISTDASVVDRLPAGTYEIKDSYEPGVAQAGDKSIGYIGIYLGAWFHRIPGGDEYPISGMGLSGTLTISIDGDRYTIEATMYDDAKNTIKGKYVGTPTIEDHRTSAGSSARPLTYVEWMAENSLVKYADESPAYTDVHKMRIGNAQKRLK